MGFRGWAAVLLVTVNVHACRGGVMTAESGTEHIEQRVPMRAGESGLTVQTATTTADHPVGNESLRYLS
jgi:hypothetical protein